MVYMVTFTINIPQMLAYIAYMDPMGIYIYIYTYISIYPSEILDSSYIIPDPILLIPLRLSVQCSQCRICLKKAGHNEAQ